jgi:DNA end-binding protein Ku
MAGAARWKGSVAFGPLLQIPVIAKTAVKEDKISFNQHHRVCGARLATGTMVCTGCGADVPKSDVVKGFEGKAGIDEEYLAGLAVEKSTTMTLDGLVPATQIDARFYQKSYTLAPDKGGEKGYVLMLRLLEKSQRVAIGKVAMVGKEFIVTVRPREGVLAMELMYWPAELVSDIDARAAIDGVEVSEAEMKMGEQLVQFLSRDFEPAQYTNKLLEAQVEYLEKFLADEAPAPLPAPKKAEEPTTDLASALEMSLRALGGQVEEKVAAKRGRKQAA